MKKGRFNIQGLRDYTGVSLEDIIADLRKWHSLTGVVIRRLIELKDEIKSNLERLEDADSIIGYIDYFIDLFQGYETDFKRIVDEIGHRVEEKHIKIINQIFESSRNEEKLHSRGFKREHIAKNLKDESLRPLLDEIYIIFEDLLLRNINLSSLSRRLQTFIGNNVYRKKLPIDISEIIEIKPGIWGIRINFNYIIKRLFGWVRNKK